MKLALITPPANLSVTTLLPGRFCIASIAGKNPAYRDWFAEQQTAGYEVMLDNGVFEGARMDEEIYSHVVSCIRPTVLIAHDIINDDLETNYERALAFADGLKKATEAAITEEEKVQYKPEIMFVIQTSKRDWNNVEVILTKFLADERLQWLGICRDFAYQMVGQTTQTDDQELNRMVLCSILEEQSNWMSRIRKAGKKIHFLGIGDNVHLLQYAWYVDSADTASFCWQASLQNTIGSVGVLYTKYRRPYNYFDMDFGEGKEFLMAVSHNCYAAQRYAQMAIDRRRKMEGGRL